MSFLCFESNPISVSFLFAGAILEMQETLADTCKWLSAAGFSDISEAEISVFRGGDQMVGAIIFLLIVALLICKKIAEGKARRFIGIKRWDSVSDIDINVTVKSRQALENYTFEKYLKDTENGLSDLRSLLNQKLAVKSNAEKFLTDGGWEVGFSKNKVRALIGRASYVGLRVVYISRANNVLGSKIIDVYQGMISRYEDHPELLMSKSELNKLNKEKEKAALDEKKHNYYDKVNQIIDRVSENKDKLVIKKNAARLDDLVARLFDRSVNSIQKIKSTDSDEWKLIDEFLSGIGKEIDEIVTENDEILKYYDSGDFQELKRTCENLMGSQREFNEYIEEKAESISRLFGTRIVRNDTVNQDEYNYIRPYKKTITPFTAEVSASVFSSAENNPLEYVVKNFYPDKEQYPEQIKKLQILVEELETLKEARVIIDNYKKDYAKYIQNVPAFILEKDEAGFYSRLGFANIDESVLTVEYSFVYTSGGGMAQRSFSVPMTEETIVALINKTISRREIIIPAANAGTLS